MIWKSNLVLAVVVHLGCCICICQGVGSQLLIHCQPGNQTTQMLCAESLDMLLIPHQVPVIMFCCALYDSSSQFAGSSWYSSSYSSSASTTIIDNVVCTGNESRLLDCSHSENYFPGSYPAVGVRCQTCKKSYIQLYVMLHLICVCVSTIYGHAQQKWHFHDAQLLHGSTQIQGRAIRQLPW